MPRRSRAPTFTPPALLVPPLATSTAILRVPSTAHKCTAYRHCHRWDVWRDLGPLISFTDSPLNNVATHTDIRGSLFVSDVVRWPGIGLGLSPTDLAPHALNSNNWAALHRQTDRHRLGTGDWLSMQGHPPL